MLRMPVLGLILRKIAVARFCRTLSTLISSGVPILDGLEITAKTSGNSVIEDAVMVTRKSIERGETIAVPLKETRVFPAMVTQMIGVGEATGALDTMLEKIADFYEEEVDVAVAGLLTLLEPIMIAVLGDRGRRHRHRDVSADFRPHQQADVGNRSVKIRCQLRVSGAPHRPLTVLVGARSELVTGDDQRRRKTDGHKPFPAQRLTTVSQVRRRGTPIARGDGTANWFHHHLTFFRSTSWNRGCLRTKVSP